MRTRWAAETLVSFVLDALLHWIEDGDRELDDVLRAQTNQVLARMDGVGLAIKEVEGVQAAMFTGIFPIVFISSALVPVQGMVSWIQPIAKHNPVTIWANCARVLALGDVALPIDPGTKIPTTSLEGLIFLSTIWVAGLLIVFVPVSIRMYRKLT